MSAAARAPTHAARVTGVCGVVFAASAAATIAWCRSMAAMGMPMPGGWTMSMAWMRWPDQGWSGAAASFLAMWLVMMPAMMLPASVPALRRYAEAAADAGAGPVGRLVVIAAVGYFSVWTAVGAIVFPIGATLADVAMARPDVARAVPLAIGATLLLAGLWQLTGAKARALACCGEAAEPAAFASASTRSALVHGIRLGTRCLRCCGNLMVVLLVVGVMDVTAMAAVTVAITIERVAPGACIAKSVGVAVITTAVLVITRTIAL